MTSIASEVNGLLAAVQKFVYFILFYFSTILRKRIARTTKRYQDKQGDGLCCSNCQGVKQQLNSV